MTSTLFQPDEPAAKEASASSLAAIESALARALANLKDREQNGWWPYVTNNGPSTEATAWCALSLYAAARDAESNKKTTTFLLNKQNRDGGWSTAPSCGASDWSTAPAVLALRLLNEQAPLVSKDALERAILKGSNFLFDLRTDPFRSVARLLLFLTDGEKGLQYARGWPWNKDCSFWVEPTCYSLLALKLPRVPDRSIIRSSIFYAGMYLQSHVCLTGGWNHGASYVLRVHAPHYTVTTAEVLLALQDEPRAPDSPTYPTMARALELITNDYQDSDSSLPLAWSILALHAWGRNLNNKPAKLLAHQNDDGSFGTNNLVTAISILALLAAGRNYNLLKI